MDTKFQANDKAKQLVVKMCLEDDDIEDIQNDIIEAQKIWNSIVGGPEDTIDMSTVASTSDDGPICKIMESLGATYSIDDHGNPLETISSKHNSSMLDFNSFVDWYIAYLYKNDDDEEYCSEIEIEHTTTSTNSNSNWNSTTWTITPSTSIEGETWKCNSCYVINKLESKKCISCEGLNPACNDGTNGSFEC